MSVPTKALLINTGVFEATDSVRKSVATYGDNFASAAGEFRDIKTSIGANQSKTFEGLAPVSASVLRVSRPVQLTIHQDGTPDSPATEVVLLVRRLFVWDFTYSRIVVKSLGSPLYMTLQQA